MMRWLWITFGLALGVMMVVLAMEIPDDDIGREPTSLRSSQPLLIELDTRKLSDGMSAQASTWLSRSRWVQLKFWGQGGKVLAITNSDQQSVSSLFRDSRSVLSEYIYLREGLNQLFVRVEFPKKGVVVLPLEIEYSP